MYSLNLVFAVLGALEGYCLQEHHLLAVQVMILVLYVNCAKLLFGGERKSITKMKVQGPSETENNFEFLLLQYARAGQCPQNIGVLLLDSSKDVLRMRFPFEWEGFNEAELELLTSLAEDLYTKAMELGAIHLILYLEETLSNALLLSERYPVRTTDPDKELERLFKVTCPQFPHTVAYETPESLSS